MNGENRTPQYSILVATLNERHTIESCLRRILAVYPTGCEIVVVNGGSDGTGDIVEALARENPAVRHVVNRDDRGKGHAIRVGISLARAPIHAQIDADLQFLPEELPRVIDPVQRGEADIVLGSRFMKGAIRHPGSTPPMRTFGNRVVSAYASVLFGQWMTDVQAGLKAWSAAASRCFDLCSDNYSYEAEIAAKGVMRGLRVIEVPITTAARQGGRSNVTPLKAGVALLRDLTLFRFGWK